MVVLPLKIRLNTAYGAVIELESLDNESPRQLAMRVVFERGVPSPREFGLENEVFVGEVC